MTRRAENEMPLFVSRETAAKRCEVSADTFDQWVKDGYLPGPHIKRGTTRRWHWPTIEAKLVGEPASVPESDPYMKGIDHALRSHRAAS